MRSVDSRLRFRQKVVTEQSIQPVFFLSTIFSLSFSFPPVLTAQKKDRDRLHRPYLLAQKFFFLVHRRKRTVLCRSPGLWINRSVRPSRSSISGWLNRGQNSPITVAGPRRYLTCFPLSFPKQEEHKTTLFSYRYYISTLFFCQSGKCPARKSLHRNQHTPTLEHGCQSKISVLQQPCRQNIAGCS